MHGAAKTRQAGKIAKKVKSESREREEGGSSLPAWPYLALAVGAGGVGHMPGVSAETRPACGVLARLSDVV